MSCYEINYHINFWKRKFILRAWLVKISKVITYVDALSWLASWYYVRDPIWKINRMDESHIDHFLQLYFNQQGNLGMHLSHLLLNSFSIHMQNKVVNHKIQVQSKNVYIGPCKVLLCTLEKGYGILLCLIIESLGNECVFGIFSDAMIDYFSFFNQNGRFIRCLFQVFSRRYVFTFYFLLFWCLKALH